MRIESHRTRSREGNQLVLRVRCHSREIDRLWRTARQRLTKANDLKSAELHRRECKKRATLVATRAAIEWAFETIARSWSWRTIIDESPIIPMMNCANPISRVSSSQCECIALRTCCRVGVRRAEKNKLMMIVEKNFEEGKSSKTFGLLINDRELETKTRLKKFIEMLLKRK